jgi:hypothetical protein
MFTVSWTASALLTHYQRVSIRPELGASYQDAECLYFNTRAVMQSNSSWAARMVVVRA